MKLKQATGVLETHNRWRRGEDVEPMLNPTDIGIAIDTVVEYIKNNGVLDDVSSCDAEYLVTQLNKRTIHPDKDAELLIEEMQEIGIFFKEDHQKGWYFSKD